MILILIVIDKDHKRKYLTQFGRDSHNQGLFYQ